MQTKSNFKINKIKYYVPIKPALTIVFKKFSTISFKILQEMLQRFNKLNILWALNVFGLGILEYRIWLPSTVDSFTGKFKNFQTSCTSASF